MTLDPQERPQDEQRFERIVQMIPMGLHIYHLEDEDRLVLVANNQAADRILGVEQAARQGREIADAFPGVTDSPVPEAFRQVARTGEPWRTEQYRYDEGEIQGAFEIYAFQIAPREVAALFTDVTEQTRTKAALERYRDHLEALLEQLTREFQLTREELVRNERLVTLGRLTASVAHELRNPLGVLQAAFFALRDGKERGDERRVDRSLAIAERTIDRVEGIISELLDYSHHRRIRKEPTDLDAWLRGVLDDLIVRPGVIFDRELRCGRRVDLDRQQVQSAVIHLVANALQALDEHDDTRERRMTVTTRAMEQWIEIRVLDTGPGIPDDLKDRIFEPLFSTKSFGVGLGLPIVRQVADAHAGELLLYSVPERGTTAVLRLPARSLTTSTEEADRTQWARTSEGPSA